MQIGSDNRHAAALAMLFYASLTGLFAHEVDAAVRAEWRLLYVLRDLPAQEAAAWFVALHVPLFAATVQLTHHWNLKTRARARTALTVFAILHAALHFRLRNDPLSDFSSPLSVVLIYGAALSAACFLILSWRSHGAGVRMK